MANFLDQAIINNISLCGRLQKLQYLSLANHFPEFRLNIKQICLMRILVPVTSCVLDHPREEPVLYSINSGSSNTPTR
jgi:hypothetical protein